MYIIMGGTPSKQYTDSTPSTFDKIKGELFGDHKVAQFGIDDTYLDTKDYTSNEVIKVESSQSLQKQEQLLDEKSMKQHLSNSFEHPPVPRQTSQSTFLEPEKTQKEGIHELEQPTTQSTFVEPEKTQQEGIHELEQPNSTSSHEDPKITQPEYLKKDLDNSKPSISETGEPIEDNPESSNNAKINYSQNMQHEQPQIKLNSTHKSPNKPITQANPKSSFRSQIKSIPDTYQRVTNLSSYIGSKVFALYINSTYLTEIKSQIDEINDKSKALFDKAKIDEAQSLLINIQKSLYELSPKDNVDDIDSNIKILCKKLSSLESVYTGQPDNDFYNSQKKLAFLKLQSILFSQRELDGVLRNVILQVMAYSFLKATKTFTYECDIYKTKDGNKGIDLKQQTLHHVFMADNIHWSLWEDVKKEHKKQKYKPSVYHLLSSCSTIPFASLCHTNVNEYDVHKYSISLTSKEDKCVWYISRTEEEIAKKLELKVKDAYKEEIKEETSKLSTFQKMRYKPKQLAPKLRADIVKDIEEFSKSKDVLESSLVELDLFEASLTQFLEKQIGFDASNAEQYYDHVTSQVIMFLDCPSMFVDGSIKVEDFMKYVYIKDRDATTSFIHEKLQLFFVHLCRLFLKLPSLYIWNTTNTSVLNDHIDKQVLSASTNRKITTEDLLVINEQSIKDFQQESIALLRNYTIGGVPIVENVNPIYTSISDNAFEVNVNHDSSKMRPHEFIIQNLQMFIQQQFGAFIYSNIRGDLNTYDPMLRFKIYSKIKQHQSSHKNKLTKQIGSGVAHEVMKAFTENARLMDPSIQISAFLLMHKDKIDSFNVNAIPKTSDVQDILSSKDMIGDMLKYDFKLYKHSFLSKTIFRLCEWLVAALMDKKLWSQIPETIEKNKFYNAKALHNLTIEYNKNILVEHLTEQMKTCKYYIDFTEMLFISSWASNEMLDFLKVDFKHEKEAPNEIHKLIDQYSYNPETNLKHSIIDILKAKYCNSVSIYNINKKYIADKLIRLYLASTKDSEFQQRINFLKHLIKNNELRFPYEEVNKEDSISMSNVGDAISSLPNNRNCIINHTHQDKVLYHMIERFNFFNTVYFETKDIKGIGFAKEKQKKITDKFKLLCFEYCFLNGMAYFMDEFIKFLESSAPIQESPSKEPTIPISSS